MFDCISYVYVDAKLINKLDAKSNKCIFIGYGSDEFRYQLWDNENQKVIRSRDVVFNEKTMYKEKAEMHQGKKESVEHEDVSEGEEQ